MIYTVTFNPSIDYIVNVDNFMTGVVNRTSKEIIFSGWERNQCFNGTEKSWGRKHSTWIYGRIYRRCHHTASSGERCYRRFYSRYRRIVPYQRKTPGTDRDGNQRTGIKDCIRRYSEALRKTGCIAGWRYTGTCRKHPGHNAGIHVYGYHGASAEQETQYCSRCDQRSADECTCLSSVFDQTKQS